MPWGFKDRARVRWSDHGHGELFTTVDSAWTFKVMTCELVPVLSILKKECLGISRKA